MEDKITIIMEPASTPNNEPNNCLTAKSLPLNFTGIVFENKFTHLGPGMLPKIVIIKINTKTKGIDNPSGIYLKRKK